MIRKFITKNYEETQKLGEALANEILKRQAGKKAIVLALEGDLGGGKTTFTQGLARGLKIKGQITSPSFVLIKNYRIAPPQSPSYIGGGRREGLKNFYHIDCYRLNKPWQLQELGLEEIISAPKNLVVIEWAERVEEILPEDKIVIKFEWVDGNKRKITFKQGSKIK